MEMVAASKMRKTQERMRKTRPYRERMASIIGHLAKAKLIPLQELDKRLAEIDKSKPVLLYCRSGHRSGNALKILQGKGFANAKHIEGGIIAWQAAGLPVTR